MATQEHEIQTRPLAASTATAIFLSSRADRNTHPFSLSPAPVQPFPLGTKKLASSNTRARHAHRPVCTLVQITTPHPLQQSTPTMKNESRKGRKAPSPLKLVQVAPGTSLRARPKFQAPERPGKSVCFIAAAIILTVILADAVGTIHVSPARRRVHGSTGTVAASTLPSFSELANSPLKSSQRTSSPDASPTTPDFSPSYSPFQASPGLPLQQPYRARSSSTASLESNTSQKSATSSSSSMFRRFW